MFILSTIFLIKDWVLRKIASKNIIKSHDTYLIMIYVFLKFMTVLNCGIDVVVNDQSSKKTTNKFSSSMEINKIISIYGNNAIQKLEN